jgi:hypothetical protein
MDDFLVQINESTFQMLISRSVCVDVLSRDNFARFVD